MSTYFEEFPDADTALVLSAVPAPETDETRIRIICHDLSLLYTDQSVYNRTLYSFAVESAIVDVVTDNLTRVVSRHADSHE